MNIFTVLKQDHEQLKQLFAEMEAADEESEESREELVDELEQSLTAHADAEEATFYEALLANDKTKDIITKSEEGHEKAKQLLEDLKAIDTTDEAWKPALQELSKGVTKHIEMEETETFAKAKDILSDEDAERIGDKFQEEKERILTEM